MEQNLIRIHIKCPELNLLKGGMEGAVAVKREEEKSGTKVTRLHFFKLQILGDDR